MGNGKIDSNPTISLCMIVKDEEQALPRCLQSVSDQVDEIIVVDTGSADRTIEIAESFGARVYHHPWENNFSKHRNQSISYATSDWILILDADEELDKETAHLLKDAVRKKNISAVSIIVRSYLEGAAFHNETISPRLFRSGLGFHYVGLVHNQPVFDKKASVTCPVVVWHYGYDLSPEDKEKKHRRSLGLLHEQVKRWPEDAPTRHHLAMTYFAKQQWEKAAEEAQECLALVDRKGLKDPGYSWTYYVVVASLISLQRFADAEKWARRGIRFYRKSPDLFFCQTTIAFHEKDFHGIIKNGKEFLRLRKLLQENPGEFGFVVFETVNKEWKIYCQMGYAQFYRGAKEQAVHLLKKGLRCAPEDEQEGLREEIGANCLKFKEPEGAVYFLDGLPADKTECRSSLMTLLSAYEELRLFGKMDELCRELRNTFPRDPQIPFKQGLARMQLEQTEEAAECFERAAELEPKHVAALVNWGLALERRGENQRAEEKYLAALDIDSGSAIGNLNLGVFYFKNADHLRATRYLAEACCGFPDNVYLHLALARSYVEAGDIEAVLGPCENILRLLALPADFVIESVSQLADLFVNISEKLFREKKLESFDIAFDLARLLQPARAEELKNLARIALEQSEYERAVGILEVALAVNPRDAELLTLIQGQVRAFES